MSSRNTMIGIVIGLIALGCCLLALLVGAGAVAYYATDGFASLRNPTATQDPNWTPGPAPTPGATEIAQMDEIAAQVIAMRGLQPTGPVERKLLSVEEVRQRTLDEFKEDTTPEDWENDRHVLAALGLIQPDLDLYDLLLRLYSEGVAGFYDPDTKELVLVSAQGMSVYDQVTFAHEYNHALQDQNYDVRKMGFSKEGWENDSEKAAAAQALLEGDSSLLEEQYKATLSRAQQREYDRIANAFDVSVYFELPDFLLQDFLFPYQQGLDFVRRYYDEGGWPRVDEVWRDPPVSTEQIIHPERYEAGDRPLVVARPALTDTLGAGWKQIESNVMGEWYTYLILAYGVDPDTRLADRTAYEAAEGWGGDGYAAYYNDAAQQIVLALQWEWDSEADAEEFARAFADYGDQRFGQAQPYADRTCWNADALNCFFADSQHTLWIMAPDQATMEAVLEQYPDFK